MKILFLNSKQLWLLTVVAFALVTFAYTYTIRQMEYQKLQQQLDQQLLQTAYLVVANLQPQHIIKLTPDNSKLEATEKTLKQFAQINGLESIDILLLQDYELFMISSNPHPISMNEKNHLISLVPSHTLPELFKTHPALFKTYQEYHQHFRMLVLPYHYHNQAFLIKINADLAGLQRQLNDVFWQAFESAVLLLLIGCLMILAYFYPFKRWVFSHPITKLPNRTQLLWDIERSPNPMLIILNISCFQQIVNFYGKNAGTFVIQEIAKRCRRSLPSSAKLYHIGHTDMAILALNTLAHRGYVCMDDIYLEDLLKSIEDQPFKYQEHIIPIVITAGVAGSKRQFLIEHAFKALKFAQNEKKTHVIFQEVLHNTSNNQINIEWAKKLKDAIDNDEIIPSFQPIINNKTGEVEKYECLVRMLDKDGVKEITPDCFLSTAKNNRLYPNITRLMIDKSFYAFRHLDYQFSINLSAEDLIDPSTRGFIISQLRSYPKPQQVIFEIMSLKGIDNFQEIASDVKIIRHLGAHIAIDGFGSDCSNFDEIYKLSADFIKIDSSLIQNLDSNQYHRILVETIVNFANKMNIKTVAKFVSSKEIYEQVQSIGIDYSQGNYFGKAQTKLVELSDFKI